MLLAAALAVSAADVTAQVAPSGKPGIVKAGSVADASIPQGAKDFINKYYPGQSIVSVDNNFIRTEYDVSLLNGVDIEFNGKGKVRKIEAPDGTVLPDNVVRNMLPAKAYRHLSENGLAGYVEEISLDRRGYEVSLLLDNIEEVNYAADGEFIKFDN